MPTKKLVHITETYRNDENSRLVRVEAYYQNNTPTGVGVIIDGMDLALVDEMMTDYEDVWRKADANRREDIVAIYFRQLDAWGTTRAADRSNRDNYLCALNIAFLERHGYLEGDRYNGCRFTYDVDPVSLDELLEDAVDREHRLNSSRK